MKSILDLRDFESLSANEQIHLVGAFSGSVVKPSCTPSLSYT